MQIHIATPDGNQKVCLEPDVRQRWTLGALPAGTVYWREGMAEWKTIGELFSGGAVPRVVPPPVPVSSSPFTFTKDPNGLTMFVTVMLWISLGVDLLSLSDFGQLVLANSQPISMAAAEANDARQHLIGGLTILTFLITGIPFLLWIYRANLNARGFGATTMEFHPGWSVGYYFIPIMNLFKPYQAMQQIWKASHNPQNWLREPDSSDCPECGIICVTARPFRTALVTKN